MGKLVTGVFKSWAHFTCVDKLVIGVFKSCAHFTYVGKLVIGVFRSCAHVTYATRENLMAPMPGCLISNSVLACVVTQF